MFSTFIKASNEFTDKEKSIPAPYLRKGFDLDFKPKNAKIYIVSSGFYELYLNGERITKGFLAPYISNPDDMLCYDVYDVSDRLCVGKNAVGIILGNGFANQPVDGWEFASASFRAPLCCSLTLTAENGEKSFTLDSDESFKTHPSHIIYDTYRYGTHLDARKEIKGFSEAEFDDSGWENALIAIRPKGEIVPCIASPIIKREELTPISITYHKDICYLKTALHGGSDIPSTKISGYLYDFGKSTAGVCKVKIKGENGQKVTVRHCEKLSDEGRFNVNSIYTFKSNYAEYIHLFQTDVYTLKGGETEIFLPPFTYHGFRYAFVEGITEEQATKDLLTFEVISSSITQRTDFNCSDETVNTLYAMGINADLSNFHYFPTDCPHREKNGWTGDISVSAEQMLLHFDCTEDMRLWLKTLAHAQRDDGSLPGIAPTGGWGFKWGNGPMWDSACVTVPYYIYKYYGKTDVLSECSEMIYRYLKYVLGRRDGNGLVAIGLGDWCQPRKTGESIASPLILTDSVTVYDIAKKASLIFDVLGKTQEKAFADDLAKQMRSAIREHLIDLETMTAVGSCQTSQALILSLGLIEEDERKAAYKRLLDFINEKDGHVYCGMIGLRYIFEVLAEGGDIDLALKMICRPDEPSYGSMIARGATALCEALMENGLNESENHHFFGDILRIFHSYIAGLRVNPNMRDGSEVVFSPVIPSGMQNASGSLVFPSGKADFGWKRCEKDITAYINVPKGVHGFYRYGSTVAELKEGYQEFKI